jgi:hypothetical protein
MLFYALLLLYACIPQPEEAPVVAGIRYMDPKQEAAAAERGEQQQQQVQQVQHMWQLRPEQWAGVRKRCCIARVLL